MSTIKISELPVISAVSSNTANTIFIGLDVPTNVTGKMTLTTLAQGMYSNNTLAVGNNYTILPNVVGQFSGNSVNYIQVNLQNQKGNGSGDIVVTADSGDDSNYYIDMGFNGSTYNFPGYTYANPLDGYLVVQGSVSNSALPGGNLVIGTTTAGKTISFLQGTTDANGIVAQFIANTGLKLTKKPLIFADGTSQNSAVDYSGVNSRVSSNISIVNNSITTNVAALNGSITSNITTVTATAQGAYTKANNALANSTGTFAGDLTITGNTSAQRISTANISVVGTANVTGTLNVVGAVSMNATLVLANSNFQATEAAVTISASPTVATPANDGYMIHISGKNGVPSRIVSDSYGTGAYSVYASRTARGNVASPSAVQTGDIIGRFSANGFGTTKFQQFGTGRIDFVATENYTDANTGSQIQFWNCPVGSNTLTNILTLNGQSAVFTGVVNPQKGFIYTPRLPVGAQTAITIDYSSDAIVKANCSGDITFSHSNFTTGKVVEVWLTNTAGTNHTVTHGISALNSTTNSTTFTIPSTSSAYMRFFSIDGDLANTFVTVTHA